MYPDGFTQEELESLKTEFKTLSTLEEKMNFWSSKLHFNYCHYDDLLYPQWREFWIRPTSPEETEKLNLLILAEAQFYFLGYGRTFKENKEYASKKTVYVFEELKEAINEKLKEAKNPLPIIEKEIIWILDLVKKIEERNLRFDIPNHPEGVRAAPKDAIQSFWLSGYEGYYIKGKNIDLTQNDWEPRNLFALNNGFVIAQYREYLENYLKENLFRVLDFY